MAKHKQGWKMGDIFAIRQSDGEFTTGQVIDIMMPNVITCGFFESRSKSIDSISISDIAPQSAIACISCTREQLDFGAWNILGHRTPLLDKRLCANEQYRAKRWIGAKIYDAAIVEDFLEAFFCLLPWDKYFDPKYFDKMLISPEKKAAAAFIKQRSLKRRVRTIRCDETANIDK